MDCAKRYRGANPVQTNAVNGKGGREPVDNPLIYFPRYFPRGTLFSPSVRGKVKEGGTPSPCREKSRYAPGVFAGRWG
jgi:hypothetical protein